MKLNEVLQFITLTNQARAVRRVAYTKGVEEPENDLDHSAQLALVAWLLVEKYKLELNVEKILKYALAHDLAEVYAGDVFLFDKDQTKHEHKKEKEQAALVRLEKEFPNNPSVWIAAWAYMNKSDKEAVFVYALDKFVTILNHLEDGGVWKKYNITFEALLEKKSAKVNLAPELREIYAELVEHLTQHKQELFAPEQ